MSSLINKVKDKVEAAMDKSSSSSTHNTHSTHGTHTTSGPTTTSGNYDTQRTDNTGYGSGTTSSSTTTAGPHSSNLANKADPRVDSDMDGSRTMGGNRTTGTGMGSTTGSGMGSNTGTGFGSNTGSTNVGPHDSNLANRADPRVDSDLDGSRTMGGNRTTGVGMDGNTDRSTGVGLGGNTDRSTGVGLGGNTDRSTGVGLSGNSDRSTGVGLDANTGSGMGDNRSTGVGLDGRTGAGYGSDRGNTTSGSGIGQKAQEYMSTGSGQSTNAGPHNSDLLNKMDPRVDSNLDGSKTFGGDATRR